MCHSRRRLFPQGKLRQRLVPHLSKALLQIQTLPALGNLQEPLNQGKHCLCRWGDLLLSSGLERYIQALRSDCTFTVWRSTDRALDGSP